MKIVHIDNGAQATRVLITAFLGKPEFAQLNGHLENLCVFAPQLITDRATLTKTGARNSAAKYILFPKVLRPRFPIAEFDVGSLTCGTVKHGENLFVIYKVSKLI